MQAQVDTAAEASNSAQDLWLELPTHSFRHKFPLNQPDGLPPLSVAALLGSQLAD